MKRSLVYIVLLLLGAMHTQAITENAKVTFKIDNATEGTIRIFAGDEVFQQKVNKDGIVVFDLPIEKEVFASFEYEKAYRDCYLYPGVDVNINFDYEKNREFYEVQANDQGENELLVNWLKYNLVLCDVTLDFEDFCEQMKGMVFTKYKELTKDKNYSDFFKKGLIEMLRIHTHCGLDLYQPTYEYQVENILELEELRTDPAIFEEMREFCTIKEDIKNSNVYRSLINKLCYAVAGVDATSEKNHREKTIRMVAAIDHQPLRNAVLFDIYNIAIQNRGFEKSKSTRELIKLYLKDTDYYAQCLAIDASNDKVAKGKQSPGFSMPDINGKTVKLEDFKGYYVYIDCWATWCGPCKAQIPHLQELEHKYAGKKIKFVSIGCDSDQEPWKTFVQEKELGGIQLFGGVLNLNTFLKAYNVKAIPRFILIDDEGKIVDPDAPRPSDPEVHKLLEVVS
ncbi:MAG: TlpA family protein disulfide reductase [Carboxylicivirga sp.]|jgi:thiol-disulfide isomerase/thioredoxin|nr:TlpA family protein disulfide reductase [Carboxylicivirga sp.]